MKRIAVEGLSLSYPDTRKGHKNERIDVLDDVSFDVEDGRCVALIGPSGSGKTSILKAILGLVPFRGTIEISGIDSARLSLRNRNIAYVSQSFPTIAFWSVYQNIALPLKTQRIPRKEIDERVEAIAKELGIDHLLSRKPSRISAGQQQRVALARAFIRPCDAYLLDEPFASLDQTLRFEMRQLLKGLLEKRHATILLVTHDINDALSLADEILEVDEGKIAWKGSHEEYIERLKAKEEEVE